LNTPWRPLDQRLKMLEALGCVDIVRPYYELEYVTACRELDVDIFVVGEDWGSKPHNLNVESYLKSKGKRVVKLVYNSRNSSSAIKNDVMAQNPGYSKVAMLRPFVGAEVNNRSSNETRLAKPTEQTLIQ